MPPELYVKHVILPLKELEYTTGSLGCHETSLTKSEHVLYSLFLIDCSVDKICFNDPALVS